MMEEKPTVSGNVELVKQFHDQAYVYIDQALSLEETGRSAEALDLYEKGLRQLDQGLSIRCDQPQCVGENWDTGRMLQMKMRKTREQVTSRLEHLSKERAAAAAPAPPQFTEDGLEMPPSYEEACSATAMEWTESGSREGPVAGPSGPPPMACNSEKPYSYVQRELQYGGGNGLGACSEVPVEAREIFSIPDGVQIFFVSPNGDVSAPSYPTALAIYRFSAESMTPTGERRPPAFLEVGEWVYPLHPGRMPVLQTAYGAYMFPDTNSTDSGSAIGLLLADEIPRDARVTFEHMMCELTAFKSQQEVRAVAQMDQDERRLSTKISDGLVIGAEKLTKGMVYGAEKTNDYIRLAASKLRKQMTPATTPTHVDPKLQKGLQIARDVSGVAVRVSGFILTQLGKATMALGHQLAPQVRKHSARLISKAMGETETQKVDTTINDVFEVAAGGLKGFSTVYNGLEQSAQILANGLISETVHTVNHKYGSAAGVSTDNTLHTVGNVAMTAHNMSNMGVKAVAKRAAKDTGKALVQQYKSDDGQNEKSACNGTHH